MGEGKEDEKGDDKEEREMVTDEEEDTTAETNDGAFRSCVLSL